MVRSSVSDEDNETFRRDIELCLALSPDFGSDAALKRAADRYLSTLEPSDREALNHQRQNWLGLKRFNRLPPRRKTLGECLAEVFSQGVKP